jgi:hypothetical protein
MACMQGATTKLTTCLHILALFNSTGRLQRLKTNSAGSCTYRTANDIFPCGLVWRQYGHWHVIDALCVVWPQLASVKRSGQQQQAQHVVRLPELNRGYAALCLLLQNAPWAAVHISAGASALRSPAPGSENFSEPYHAVLVGCRVVSSVGIKSVALATMMHRVPDYHIAFAALACHRCFVRQYISALGPPSKAGDKCCWQNAERLLKECRCMCMCMCQHSNVCEFACACI